MSRPEWTLRSLRKTQRDRQRLAAFACGDRSIPWQAEVEAFVQTDLFDWRYAPLAKDDDPRVLVLLRGAELVGVAAHERVTLKHGDDAFAATRLTVLALTRAWQGRSFATGERASDVLMSAVMVDVSKRVPPRFARVLAIVHEANLRSVALCRRYGFLEELSRLERHPTYRRLLTAHSTR